MKKIVLITNYLLLITSFNVSFAQTYPVTCPSEAQSIVNAVGGCSAVDKNQYSAVYDNCCVVSSELASKMTMALWIVAVIVGLGLAILGARYYSARKKDLSSRA